MTMSACQARKGKRSWYTAMAERADSGIDGSPRNVSWAMSAGKSSVPTVQRLLRMWVVSSVLQVQWQISARRAEQEGDIESSEEQL